MIQSSNTAAEDAPLLANNEHHLINQPRYHSSNDDRLHYEEQQPPRIKGPAGDRSWVKTHKMRLFFISIILVILFVLSILADALKAASFSYNDINTIISFGDSYTTRYLDMESLSYLCRNCTSAGGPNWVIYLTDSTGWLSFDFAYNSAPVNNSIVNQAPTVIDVSTQVRELYPKIFVSPTEKISAILKSTYKDKERTAKSTLTTLWVGINDIDLTYDWENTDTLDSNIMQRYQVLIDILIERGENQFMLINVPPLERAPMWHSTAHKDLIKTRVSDYNRKLHNMVKRLKRNHSSATFIEYDAWSFFDHLLDHAKEFDMTDVLSYCPDWSHPLERSCKPIGEYFWLNDLHPTFRVHELMANDIQRYLKKY